MSRRTPDLRTVDFTPEPGKKYTAAELELMADAMLRYHADEEPCPDCGLLTLPPRNRTDNFVCEEGHSWPQPGHNSATRTGIGGKNPILFREHEWARRRREVYVQSGTPDPSIEAGIFHRPHNPNLNQRRQQNPED